MRFVFFWVSVFALVLTTSIGCEMPLYDYSCEKCELDFEIYKSIKEHQPREICPDCGNPSPQNFSRCRPHFTGTKIEDAEFNIGLGRITKSKRHREELAKQLGAIEIGTEKPEKVHEHFDQQRETKRKKAYEEL